MAQDEKVIMYDSPEAAQERTLTDGLAWSVLGKSMNIRQGGLVALI